MRRLIHVRAYLTKHLDNFRARFYDFVHHVDTFSSVNSTAVRIESENKKFGVSYQRTPIRTMNTLFDKLTWSENASFIDFGCGKGLTLLAAANYSFNKIIGVEYSSDLVAIATRNVLQYRGTLGSRKNILIIHDDATQFKFPRTALICYFYNPFKPIVMENVLDNLAASFKEYPREIQLVFHSWYSQDLVRSKFNIDNFESFPYFHVYHLASAKEGREALSTEHRSWEMIDTK